jgi:hypothetical protein
LKRRQLLNRVARFFLVQTYQNVKDIPNDHKLYQKAIKYPEYPQNIPNGHKIKHFSIKGPPKFTQIEIFGLKTNHLATLHLKCPGADAMICSTFCAEIIGEKICAILIISTAMYAV